MPKRSCLGFTLIELLIVISITGVLAGIGLASYNQFNRKQILDQTAKNVKNDLRLIQSKALAGEKDCSAGVCGGSTAGCGQDEDEKELDGWYVEFTNTSYTYYGSCGGTHFSTKVVNLPSNVTIPSPPARIYFEPLNKGVSAAISITLSAFGTTQVINLTKMGEIN